MSTWLGVGIGSKNSKGDWLEVYYPRELINPSEEIIVKTKELVNYQEGNLTRPIDRKSVV